MQKIWERRLMPGEKRSESVGRNRYLRFTALGDNANLSVLLFNFFDKTEKYNMPDSLKAQHTAFFTEGNALISDNGRMLAGFSQDGLGWHDTISGHSTKAMVDARYGKTSFQINGNEYFRSGEENFKVELARNGLGFRDLVPCVNLFAKVFVESDGGMHYDPSHCKSGLSVTLKTEMAVLVILSNTPNALCESAKYPSVPILMEIFEAPKTSANDIWVAKCPENQRAFENARDYNLLLGL